MAIGMLKATSDLTAVTNSIYVEFDGVTDEWLKTLDVETVAGGQIPADQMNRVRLELARTGPPALGAICGVPS
jgi:hypothetical protein